MALAAWSIALPLPYRLKENTEWLTINRADVT